jgi:hypothetical protein
MFSARVPSHFKRSLPVLSLWAFMTVYRMSSTLLFFPSGMRIHRFQSKTLNKACQRCLVITQTLHTDLASKDVVGRIDTIYVKHFLGHNASVTRLMNEVAPEDSRNNGRVISSYLQL